MNKAKYHYRENGMTAISKSQVLVFHANINDSWHASSVIQWPKRKNGKNWKKWKKATTSKNPRNSNLAELACSSEWNVTPLKNGMLRHSFLRVGKDIPLQHILLAQCSFYPLSSYWVALFIWLIWRRRVKAAFSFGEFFGTKHFFKNCGPYRIRGPN